MGRRFPPLLAVVMICASTVMLGCRPQQPFYFLDDGDLSHYIDVAAEIEYPDVEEESFAEVEGAIRPFSLENQDANEIWRLTLEEAMQYALQNSKVMRSLGGRLASRKRDTQNPNRMPDSLTRASASPGSAGPTGVNGVKSVFDPAIAESNPRFGVEAALSAFDAQFSGSMFWEKFDTPRNTSFDFIGTQRDTGNFESRISKVNATGGTTSLSHTVAYEQSDSPVRAIPSDWNVNLQAEFRQPLLRGAGVQLNRITGPGAIPGFDNGVMIARINSDVALADFETGVRDLVAEVEGAYWQLYSRYRTLDAVIAGRDSGLQSWRYAKIELEVGKGDNLNEAQARAQYYLFKNAMETELNELYLAESNLRYIMGLAPADGRLIHPADEPTTAKVSFDWNDAKLEMLFRSVDIRRQKWIVKRRELELISSKNYLLPRLDAVGQYRWLGLGDDLGQASGGFGFGAPGTLAGSNAYQTLTDGSFQEWQFGLELSFPIGFRKEMSGVRHAQLRLAKERARFRELELEVTHQLAWAIRELEGAYQLTQTNFNRRVAAKLEVEAAISLKEVGLKGWRMSEVLDAQRRLAQAESDYYASLIDYNQLIAQVHLRKGSLLEYNGVHLTEGPWAEKAYFDALGRARKRDASFYLDYGFTRPGVVSRGAYEQHAGSGSMPFDGQVEEMEYGAEAVPTPAGVPIDQVDEPSADEPPADEPTISEPDIQTGGPLLIPGMARAEAARSGGKGAYDLGSLNLRKLSGKTDREKSIVTTGQSPVRKAAYQEPEASSETDPSSSGKTSRTSTPPQSAAWIGSKRSGSRHEFIATPPDTEIDRAASGWQRVQR